MTERTPAERQADLTARQLARETKISRPRQTAWWRLAIFTVLAFSAFVVGVVAPLGLLSTGGVFILGLLALAVIA